MASAMAKAYGCSKQPHIPTKEIEGVRFEHRCGPHFNYYVVIYKVVGEQSTQRYDVQLSSDEFYEWLGGQILDLQASNKL